MEKYWAMSHGLMHGKTPSSGNSGEKSDHWVNNHGLRESNTYSPTMNDLFKDHHLSLYDGFNEHESKGVTERSHYAMGGNVDTTAGTTPSWAMGADASPMPLKTGGRVHDNSLFDKKSGGDNANYCYEWTGHDAKKMKCD